MSERPKLDKNLDGKTFREFYYLKEELVDFCRRYGLPTSGGKLEITERIAHFLDTGEVVAAKKVQKKSQIIGNITTDTEIEPNFVCSENHRAFFKEHIGNGFSFNVAFPNIDDNRFSTAAGVPFNLCIFLAFLIRLRLT